MNDLKETNKINPEDIVFHGMTWNQFQMVLERDLSFTHPEEVFGELTAEEKTEIKKKVVRRIAKQTFRQSERSALKLVDDHIEELIKAV